MRKTVAALRPDLARARDSLNETGFCIVENALPVSSVAKLHDDLDARFARTPVCEGDFNGRLTRKFGGLLKRAELAADFVAHRDVLALVDLVLGQNCDRLQLNVTEATEVGSGEIAQVPYRDSALWPRASGCGELAVSAVWPLTSAASEAMRIWPGSHGAADFPDRPVVPDVQPGSVLLLLGSVLRGTAANQSPAGLRVVTIGYCLGWLKPYENQWLTYPPEIARSFRPELAELVGYRRDRPNLGSVDGACPSLLLTGTETEFVPAADALEPNQAIALAAFREIQSAVEAHDRSAL